MRKQWVLFAIGGLIVLSSLSVLALPAQDCQGTTCQTGQPLLPREVEPPMVYVHVLAPAHADAGQPVVYQICVENRSASDAHFVVVKNPIPKNARMEKTVPPATVVGNEIQWSLGTLTAGSRQCLQLVLRPTNAERLDNCVRVQYEHGLCTTTQLSGKAAPESSSETQVKQPQLQMTLNGPAKVFVQSQMRYQIQLSNLGEGDAAHTQVVFTVPSEASFEQASDGGMYIAESRQIRWSLGALASRKNRPLEVTLKADKIGQVLIKTEAQATGAKTQAEFRTEIVGGSGLHLNIHEERDPLFVGESTQFVITVRNTGLAPVTQLRLAALVPDEFKPTRARSELGDVPLNPSSPNPQLFEFRPFTLEPGTEKRLLIQVEAVKAGLARFRVEMQADQLTAGRVLWEQPTNVVMDLTD